MNPKQQKDDDLDKLLRSAISGKRLIRFIYREQQRIAEPHDYGIQKGIVRLFCYQIAGKSHNRIPGWRLLDVAGIRECELLETQFAGNREVSGKHHQWDEIFMRVAPPDHP
jgi:hypothetical protein